MWHSFSDKQGFADIMNGHSANVKLQECQIEQDFEGEFCLVWASGSSTRGIPTTIICKGDKRDFLAWCTTYLKSFRPITAFVRVLDLKQYLVQQNRSDNENESTGEFDGSWIGAIIGETIDAFPGIIKNQDIPLATCTNSFLNLARRTAKICCDRGCLNKLYERWDQAIRATQGNSERKTYPSGKSVRLEAGSLLLDLQSGGNAKGKEESELLEICLAIKEGGYSLKSAFNRVFPWGGEFFEPLSNGSREARLEAYEAILGYLSREMNHPQSGAMAAGLCLSLIAPGSMEYAGLLTNRRESFPSALIWYGLFAGLTRKNHVFSQFGAIGRRIQKEFRFHETVTDPPRCDISFDEIEMFLEMGKWSEYIRPKIPGYALIEIGMNASILVRTTSPQTRVDQPTLFEREETGDNELNKEFEFHIGRLRSIFKMASSKDGDGRRNRRSKR